MRGFSKAILTGNMTRDPELRTTNTGNTVCVFTVAVNRNFRDASGNQQEEVSFIDCTAWGKPGETIAQYCKKGSAILVSGRLRQHKWEDPTTKQNRSRIEVVVEDFNFMNDGTRGGNAGDGGYASSYGAPVSAGGAASEGGEEAAPEDVPDAEINIEDIPF